VYFSLRQRESEAERLGWSKRSKVLVAFLFLWGVLLPAHAQIASMEKGSLGASSATQTKVSLVRLLALDAVREVAVFENTQGQLQTVFRGKMLPGSNDRLTRVFVDSVELTQQNEHQPLIYFLKLGESLPEKRAENLEAIASKNRPVQQITITSIPIPEVELPDGHSINRSSRP
jgi:hypothetical protein